MFSFKHALCIKKEWSRLWLLTVCLILRSVNHNSLLWTLDQKCNWHLMLSMWRLLTFDCKSFKCKVCNHYAFSVLVVLLIEEGFLYICTRCSHSIHIFKFHMPLSCVMYTVNRVSAKSLTQDVEHGCTVWVIRMY